MLKNSVLSLLANISSKAVNVLVFVLIARLSGPELAGVFSLGTTYIAFFSTLTVGLDELMTRQVARERGSAPRLFAIFFTMRMLLSAIGYGAFFTFIIQVMDYKPTTSLPILIMGICLVTDSLGAVGQSLMIAHEQFVNPLLAAIAASVIKLGGSIYALASGMGLETIGWAWVLGSSTGMLIQLGGAARLAAPFQASVFFDQRIWRDTLRQILPFLASGLLLGMEYQSDMIILSEVGNETEVSLYSAAMTIVLGVLLLAQSFRAALYPQMVRFQRETPEKLGALYDRSFFYLGALALPVSVWLFLASPALIPAIFKAQFSGAILPLQIVAWLVLLNFLSIPSSRLLLTYDRQDLLIKTFLASTVTNITLNLTLDPWLGAIGASIARIGSALVIFLPAYLYTVRHFHRHKLFPALAAPALASALMAVGVGLILQINLWLTIPAGALIYGSMLYLLRGLTEEEKVWLRNRRLS
jgi:O-antigen/teichoic acid export membrane protein